MQLVLCLGGDVLESTYDTPLRWIETFLLPLPMLSVLVVTSRVVVFVHAIVSVTLLIAWSVERPHPIVPVLGQVDRGCAPHADGVS